MVRSHSSVNVLLVPLLKKNEEGIRRNIKASAPTSAKTSCVSWQDAFPERVQKASEEDI